MIEGNKSGNGEEHNKHKRRKVDNQEDDYDVDEYGNPKSGAPYKSEEEHAEQQNYYGEHHGDYEDKNEYHGKSNIENNKDFPEQGQKDEEKEKEAKKKSGRI